MTGVPSGSQPESRTGPATMLLSASDIRRLLTIKDVIDVIEQAAVEQASGEVITAPRVGLPGGGTLLMAAASPGRGGISGKIISIVGENRAAGLSTVQGLASWFDYDTRRPLVVADAPAVTALRTGALSGVATRALAPASASVLAMIGTGGQALAQVEAASAVRPVKQVRVASLHRESAEIFSKEVKVALPDVDVHICAAVREAVREAEIVCLATTAKTALVQARDLRPDVHINAVGAYRPDMRELAVSVFAAARLVCSDDPHGALREAGDVMNAVAAGALDAESLAELGMIERAGDGDQGGRGITVFKSVGSAAADLALLDLLRRRAANDPTIRSFDFSC